MINVFISSCYSNQVNGDIAKIHVFSLRNSPHYIVHVISVISLNLQTQVPPSLVWIKLMWMKYLVSAVEVTNIWNVE